MAHNCLEVQGDLTLLASVDTYMFIPTHRHVHTSKTKARITEAKDWRAVCRSCLSPSWESRMLFWDKVTKDTGLHVIILGPFPEYEHQSR